MSTHLGKISFLDFPDVNGNEIVVVGTGVSNEITTSHVNGTGELVIGIADNPIIPGVAAFRMPVGTTAERGGAGGGLPALGDTRVNSTTNVMETYNGSNWVAPGTVLQVVTGTIPATSGNTQVPLDNTIPTSAEGFQIWSQSFTPLSSTSRIIIQFMLTVAHGTVARTFTTSVFAGTTNIGSNSVSIASTSTLSTAVAAASQSISIVYTPGSTATITFSARTGTNGGGTAYVNQTATATLGGAYVSDFIIAEVQ